MGRRTAWAVLVAVVGLTGCGGGKADVTGRVTFRGKPVVYGSIMMVAPDGTTVVGPIRDGNYSISGIKTGEVMIGVISHDPTVAQKVHSARWAKVTRGIETAVPTVGVDKKKWFPLPRHLEEPETSGIRVVLKGSTQDINLE